MSDLAVSVENLSVRFGDFTAVRNVSFEVGRGEIFGFLGANGAGKTTTIRVLCGLLSPSEGKVIVAGEGALAEEGMRLKKKVGYMSQKFTLYNDMTVMENLEFASRLRKIAPEIFRKRAKELLEFIHFGRDTSVMVRDLPGGLKQQVSLAASLLHSPEVVFLDEPTAGVTPASRARFWALIRDLASRGTTVFVTTHYMDEAEQCGRVALMRAGELIALDSPRSLKKSSFPRGLLELEPRGTLSIDDLQWCRESFSLFEPYGMRFHAETRSEEDWEKARAHTEELFLVNPVDPSLEDVFIRLVEGNNR